MGGSGLPGGYAGGGISEGNTQACFKAPNAGARPMWHLDTHWRLVGEAGYDREIKHTSSTSGHLWKVTVAAEWAPRMGFLSRPAVRAYVTQATWSDSLRGQIGTPEFSTGTRGWNAGVQFETWW